MGAMLLRTPKESIAGMARSYKASGGASRAWPVPTGAHPCVAGNRDLPDAAPCSVGAPHGRDALPHAPGKHRGHGPLLQKPLVSIAGMARSYRRTAGVARAHRRLSMRRGQP
jgi:hypothetical protein